MLDAVTAAKDNMQSKLSGSMIDAATAAEDNMQSKLSNQT